MTKEDEVRKIYNILEKNPIDLSYCERMEIAKHLFNQGIRSASGFEMDIEEGLIARVVDKYFNEKHHRVLGLFLAEFLEKSKIIPRIYEEEDDYI